MKFVVSALVICFSQILHANEICFAPKIHNYKELECNWEDEEIQKFALSATLSGLKPYFNPKIQSLAGQCYRDQHEKYWDFVSNFTEYVEAFRKQLTDENSKEYTVFFRYITIVLHSVIEPIIMLKYRIRPLTYENQFSEIIRLMNESISKIENSQIEFFLKMNAYRGENFRYAEKVEKEFKKLRTIAIEKGEEILDNIKKCISSDKTELSNKI